MTTGSLWIDDLYTIEVDRLNPPTYPSWVKRVLHPEYESKRPPKYDLRKQVEPWIHSGQTLLTGGEVGSVIYQHLVRWDEVPFHFSYADLIAIPAMGVEIYRQLFGESSVFAWGSVVEGTLRGGRMNREGANLSVSYLCLDKEEIVVDWEQLDKVLGPDDLALCFKR